MGPCAQQLCCGSTQQGYCAPIACAEPLLKSAVLTCCCFLQAMQALPCPKGTFKEAINRQASCQSCPSGLTTATTSAVAASACSMAEPGYMPVLNTDNEVVAVAPCPVGTFGPDGLQCFNCTDGLTTQTPASTASSDCSAPPGFGWYPDGVGDNSPVTTAALQALQQNVVRCPAGSYKVRANNCSAQQCWGYATTPLLNCCTAKPQPQHAAAMQVVSSRLRVSHACPDRD